MFHNSGFFRISKSTLNNTLALCSREKDSMYKMCHGCVHWTASTKWFWCREHSREQGPPLEYAFYQEQGLELIDVDHFNQIMLMEEREESTLSFQNMFNEEHCLELNEVDYIN